MQNLTRRWRYKKLFKLFNRFKYNALLTNAESDKKEKP